ncbi:MAG TPA: AsmA family protein [Bauldia sp.]
MKRVAIIATVLLAMVAIVVIAVPLVVSSEFLKQRIIHRIAAITGRDVTIAGEATLALYPHFAVSVEGLAIANPPAMGSDPFVAAEGLRTRFRLLPLLLGQAEFDGFELVKPTIHFVRDAQGRPNWLMRDVAAIVPSAGAAARAAAAAPPAAEDRDVGEISVSDGTVLYDDMVSDKREAMTAVNLDVTWPDAAAPVSGHGVLQWRGEPVEFTGSAAEPMALLAGGESTVHFGIGSTPFRIAFNGKASTVAAPRLSGDATVSTPSLRRAIEWLGTPMGTGSILGAASIEGAMTLAAAGIRFDKAKVELDGNSAEGTLGLDLAGRKPAVTGTLAFATLDLSAYIEAVHADLTTDAAWLFAPARLPFAEAINADMRLSANQVVVGATRVSAVAATVIVDNGQVNVGLGEARFRGGAITGHLDIGQDGPMLAAAMQARLTDMPANAMTLLAGASALAGTADVSMDVISRGRSWAEFARGVSGGGRVVVADGSLAGFDLAKVVDALADPLAAPLAAGDDATTFAKLDATVAVAGGDVHTDDLTMDGKGFRLSLSGGGSVLSGSVNASGRLAAAGDDIPIAVSGTWRAPVVERGPPAPTGG